MATNAIGKNSKTIGINMGTDLAAKLQSRADSMGLSLSKYCKVVFMRHLESGKKMIIKEGDGLK